MKLIAKLIDTCARAGRAGWRLATRMFEQLRAHHASEAASAMAYSMFLSLIPLLICLGYALGHLVRSQNVQTALAPLLESVPDAVSRLIGTESARLTTVEGAHGVAPIAGFGFFFIASSGVAGLMNVVALTSGSLERSWWRTRIIAFLFVVGAFGLVTATGALILNLGLAGAQMQSANSAQLPAPAPEPIAGAAAGEADGELAPTLAQDPLGVATRNGGRVARRVQFWITPSQRHALSIAGIALGIVGVAAFYRVAVHRPRALRRRVLPGAVLAVFAWVVITWGFGVYVSKLGRYSVYYGGLAAIAMLLFWCWLTALALIVGAELNAQLEGIRDEPDQPRKLMSGLAQKIRAISQPDGPQGPKPSSAPREPAPTPALIQASADSVPDEDIETDSRRFPPILH